MSSNKPRKRIILVGTVVGLVSVGAVAGNALAKEEPTRVTGVSNVLDTMRTGNQIGAAEAYALAMSAAGAALPAKGTFGPADPAVQQAAQQVILTAGSRGETITQFTKAGDDGIAQLQSAVQPLAAINGPANQGIDAASSALSTAADALGPQIQPLDTTVKEAATFIQQLKAQPGG